MTSTPGAGRVPASETAVVARDTADPHGAAAAAFHRAALDAFEDAARSAGLVRRLFEIAGRCVELKFAGAALVDRIVPALAHLAADSGVPEMTVALFDSRSTATDLPCPPWGTDDCRERGEVRGFNTARFATACNYGASTLSMTDRARRESVFWAHDAAALPYYETASPLRAVLSWWLESAGMQTIHAAGVALEGDGLLLTARGGSGKTTTSLLCLEDGFGFAGDNNVVADCVASPPTCHSLYSSASLRPGNLHRLPALTPFIRNADRLATEKALLFLNERAPERMLRSFRVRAVLLPQIADATATRIVPASPGECLRALAPSSLLSLPGARGEAFARTAALVRTVPSYHLLLGSDLPAIPRLLRRFLGDLAR
jgi:hypothetical protein